MDILKKAKEFIKNQGLNDFKYDFNDDVEPVYLSEILTYFVHHLEKEKGSPEEISELTEKLKKELP